MSTATYTAKWGSDEIKVTADWSQASSPITGNLDGGYQVADFRHDWRLALREALSQCAEIEGMTIGDATVKINEAMRSAH